LPKMAIAFHFHWIYASPCCRRTTGQRLGSALPASWHPGISIKLHRVADLDMLHRSGKLANND
jgi:hypothetical protein